MIEHHIQTLEEQTKEWLNNNPGFDFSFLFFNFDLIF